MKKIQHKSAIKKPEDDEIMIPTDLEMRDKITHNNLNINNKSNSKNFPFSCYTKDSNLINFRSYGTKAGNFYITDLSLLTNFILENKISQSYAFIEVKTNYYKFMIDIDLKKEYEKLIPKPIELIDYVLSKFIDALKTLIVSPNINYIYSDKPEGYGIHVYFPFIILNNEFACAIHVLCRHLCIQDNKFNLNEEDWNKIIDISVGKQNGLRMLYNRRKIDQPNNYYKVNLDKTTYVFKNKNDMKEHIQACFYRTNEDKFNFEPVEVDNSLLYKKYNANTFKIKSANKKVNKNVKKKLFLLNTDKLENDYKIEMISELLNILAIKRLSEYESWLNVIFYCRNYSLFDMAIKISKKSTGKFDDNTIDIIKNIFSKPIPENHITHGSLFEWCYNDNYEAYKNIFLKYNLEPKLKISHSDDFLLHNFNNYKLEVFKESEKYISDKFIQKACNYIDNNDENTKRCFILHCFTGTGKSTACAKIINHYKNTCNDWSSLSILAIISRRTMSPTLQEALHNKNIDVCKMISYLDDDYKKHKVDNIYPNKLIISMEKLGHIDTSLNDYNIILLDEFNSLILNYYSDTMVSRRSECYNNMVHYIKNADMVIACDANITNCSLDFIYNIRKDILYYRNIMPNKSGIPLKIYTNNTTFEFEKIIKIDDNVTKKKLNINYSDWKKIETFCDLIKPRVEKKESVFIFTDSKTYAVCIKEFLKRFNNDDSYFLLFTDDTGSLEEIKNCNKTFLNKCVIVSPKVIYGVNIDSINYNEVYGVYKGLTINSVHMIQQIGRPRSTKSVSILFVNSICKSNKYITYEKSKNEELDKINNHKKILEEDYSTVKELMLNNNFKINIQEIDSNSIFANVHFYKIWYDKLFNNCKMDLVTTCCKEQGYDVSMLELNINDINNDTLLKVSSIMDIYNANQIKYNEAYLSGKHLNELDYKRCLTKIKENMENKTNILKDLIEKFGYNHEIIKKLLIDNKEFTKYINSLMLFKTKEQLICQKLFNYKTDIKILNQDDKKYIKAFALLKIEQIVGINVEGTGIKRFEVDKIKDDINLTDVKNKLLDLINDLALFYDNLNDNKKSIAIIKKRLTNIKYVDQLKLFYTEIYNTYDNFIIYSQKRHYFTENKIKKSRQLYFKFKKNTSVLLKYENK